MSYLYYLLKNFASHGIRVIRQRVKYLQRRVEFLLLRTKGKSLRVSGMISIFIFNKGDVHNSGTTCRGTFSRPQFVYEHIKILLVYPRVNVLCGSG